MITSHNIQSSITGGYGPIALGDDTWAGSGGSAIAGQIKVDGSGNTYITFVYNNWANTVDSGTISLNTQYELYVKYVSGSNLTIELNGTSVYNGAVNSNSPRYLGIGIFDCGNDYNITYQYIGVAVDDSDEPSNCATLE